MTEIVHIQTTVRVSGDESKSRSRRLRVAKTKPESLYSGSRHGSGFGAGLLNHQFDNLDAPKARLDPSEHEVGGEAERNHVTHPQTTVTSPLTGD